MIVLGLRLRRLLIFEAFVPLKVYVSFKVPDSESERRRKSKRTSERYGRWKIALISRHLLCEGRRKASMQRGKQLGQQQATLGRRPNGFLGLSLTDRTILGLVSLFDKTVPVR